MKMWMLASYFFYSAEQKKKRSSVLLGGACISRYDLVWAERILFFFLTVDVGHDEGGAGWSGGISFPGVLGFVQGLPKRLCG